MKTRIVLIRLIVLFATGLFSACSPKYDAADTSGKQAIIDATNIFLTHLNCTSAIDTIGGLYNSAYTDNEVRLVTASAYGCVTGIQLFQLLTDLQNNNIIANEFWKSMSKIFYSTDLSLLSKRGTATALGYDALMAAMKTGTLVAFQDQINSTSYNPGSLLADDRVDDSNFYMMFTAMAGIGALENLYSVPNPATYVKTKVLGFTNGAAAGWASAVNTAGDGCIFAASVLNLNDSIGAVAAVSPSYLQTDLQTIQLALSSWLDPACDAGCSGNAAAVIVGQAIDFSGTGCTLAAGACKGSTAARPCPVALRNYASCTGVVTEEASCAAAGIARFLNQHLLLGWN